MYLFFARFSVGRYICKERNSNSNLIVVIKRKCKLGRGWRECFSFYTENFGGIRDFYLTECLNT